MVFIDHMKSSSSSAGGAYIFFTYLFLRYSYSCLEFMRVVPSKISSSAFVSYFELLLSYCSKALLSRLTFSSFSFCFFAFISSSFLYFLTIFNFYLVASMFFHQSCSQSNSRICQTKVRMFPSSKVYISSSSASSFSLFETAFANLAKSLSFLRIQLLKMTSLLVL